MNNIFKVNSRFASLIDDVSEKKNKKNPGGNNRNNRLERKHNRNSFYRENQLSKEYESNEKVRREAEKDILTQEALEIQIIPVLNNIECSYVEKLKKEKQFSNDNLDNDLLNIKPGWVLLKHDKSTGKTIIQSNVKNTELTEEEKTLNIFKSLTKLHEKRTQEYIDFNGYDTWERNFKYPNWREREAEIEDETDDDESSEEESEDEYNEEY